MPTNVAIAKGTDWKLWTAGDFLDWLQPGLRADLIDGEKFMHSPVHLNHAKLVDFVRVLMKHWVESHDLGIVLSEIWAVRLGSRNVFMPDICWFDPGQTARLNDTFAGFAPRLAVEVLSPATADRDLGPKFSAYEEHGLDEYWILDPHEAEHRFYARDGELLVEFGREETRIQSRALRGFLVERDWLKPGQHPPVLEALEVLQQGSDA